jgi:4'-phosphopantetheinyl transferase
LRKTCAEPGENQHVEAASITALLPPWRSRPGTLVLGCDDVHVWHARLGQTPSRIESYYDTLAADERARAARFYFEKDRTHFIAARGVLRAILGCYLSRAPQYLQFCYGPHGKPALADEPYIRFNVSHSHGVALYAVTRDREVGIDIEHIRSDLAITEIAERYFSPPEAALLRALPTELQRQEFFRCWTRKEAYVKARGEGLSLPLDQFDLSQTFEGPDGWSLQDLAPAPGFVAALAVAGRGSNLTCWQWPEPRQQSV